MSKKPTYEELKQRVEELEQKAIELENSREALQGSEALFRDLVEKLPFPLVVGTAALETKYMNPQFTKVFGYTADDIPNQRAWREKLMPNSQYRAEKSLEVDRWVESEDRSIQFTRRFTDKAGGTHDIIVHVIQLEDRFYNVLEDVTARKRAEEKLHRAYDLLEQRVAERTADLVKANRRLEAEIADRRTIEEALRQSETLYRFSIESAPHGVMVLDSNHRILIFNSQLEAISGYKKAEIPDGFSWIEKMYPDGNYRRMVAEQLRNIDPEERPRIREATITRKDGQQRICQFTSSFLPSGLRILFIKDVNDQKLAEKALLESEEKYRLLVENANDAIVVAQDGAVMFANPRTLEITGYSEKELIGSPFADLIHPDDRKMVSERHELRLKGESVISNYTFRALAKTGDDLWLQVNSVPITWNDRPASLSFIRDITNEKRLESQLIHSQKMEAIGTLAGGIAHDFNNLMATIQGNVSLAMYDLGPNHPVHENLRNIEKQIQSGAKLTSQLLGYAKKGKYEVQPIDLNQLVRETSEAFGRTKKEIFITHELASNLFPIEVDQGQIEQVLLNLYVNAAEAMPAGGALLIKTENCTHAELKNQLHAPQSGGYVHLSITDSGEGIDKAIQFRIFDPFFTTKGLVGGAGLGLASVYGIVKGHNGYIEVDSDQGRGATFHIYLPATEKKVRQPVEMRSEVFQGSGTLLMVDDEEMVLDVGVRQLERLGYNVFAARTGAEAIQCFRKKKDEIDLVILDIVMPAMGGGEVFNALKKINPQVKVLLSSGYSINGQAGGLRHRKRAQRLY
ncbi:MAG: PAS domain S-box protein [Desulfobacterales bacterium]